MSFAWPIALWGLLGLGIPVAIHLLQQGHRRRISVGSLRWLKTDQQPKWRRIKLSETPLLILRLLLVSLAVFILAKPFVPDAWIKNAANLTLIHPTLARGEMADVGQDEDVRWLSPGFPPIQTSPPAAPKNLWELLQKIDSTVDADRNIRVIAPRSLQHFGETRPFLRRSVLWEAPSTDTISDGRTPLPTELAIIYEPTSFEMANRVALAIKAWDAIGIDITTSLIPIGNAPPRTPWAIWLSTEPVESPSPVILTGQRLESSLPYSSNTQVVGIQGSRVISWPVLATADAAQLPAGFADKLLEVFFSHAQPIDTNQLVALSEAIPAVDSSKVFVQQASAQTPQWLLHLLLALFCSERLLSVLLGRGQI